MFNKMVKRRASDADMLDVCQELVDDEKLLALQLMWKGKPGG